MAGVRIALPAGEMVWVCRRVDTGPALDRTAVDAFLVELYRCRHCFFTSCVIATMLDHLHQNHSDGLVATPQPAPTAPAVAPCRSPPSPTARVPSSTDAGSCGHDKAAAERFFSRTDERGASAADTSTDGLVAGDPCATRGDGLPSTQGHVDIEHEGTSLKASGLSVAEKTSPRGCHSEQGDHMDREGCRINLTKGDSAGGSDLQAGCRSKHQAVAALDSEQASSGIESAVCGPENLDRISREVDRMLRCLSPESCEMIGLVGGCHDDVDDTGFFEAMMEAARPLPRSRDEAEEADEAQSEHLFSLGLCRTSAMARRPPASELSAKMRCVPPNMVCEGAGLAVKTPDVCVQPGSQGTIPEVEKNHVFFALDAVGGNATTVGNTEAVDGEEACYSSLVVDLSAGAGAKKKRAPCKRSHPWCNVKKSCAKTAANKRQDLGKKPVKSGLTRASQGHPSASQPSLGVCSEAAAVATFTDPCFHKDDADWDALNVRRQLDKRLSERTRKHAAVCAPKRQKQRDSVRRSKPVKGFQCTECRRTFVSKPLRDIHVACHRPEGFKCHYCDFTGRRWKHMRRHLLTHNLGSLVRSADSPRVPSLAMRGHPLRGGASVRAQSAPARAQGCNPEGRKDSDVTLSRRSDCKYKCTTCGRECSSRQAMYRHAKTHTSDKPYVCSRCGHRTRLKASLDMHIRTHTGEKPFQCELCPYSSSDASCLRRHKRTHNSEKPHSCQLCSYTCIQKKCLDTHVRRTHTGEFLTCPRCPFSTFNRQSLVRHVARHRSSAEHSPRSEISAQAKRPRRGGPGRLRGDRAGHRQSQDFASETMEMQVVVEWPTGAM